MLSLTAAFMSIKRIVLSKPGRTFIPSYFEIIISFFVSIVMRFSEVSMISVQSSFKKFFALILLEN